MKIVFGHVTWSHVMFCAWLDHTMFYFCWRWSRTTHERQKKAKKIEIHDNLSFTCASNHWQRGIGCSNIHRTRLGLLYLAVLLVQLVSMGPEQLVPEGWPHQHHETQNEISARKNAHGMPSTHVCVMHSGCHTEMIHNTSTRMEMEVWILPRHRNLVLLSYISTFKNIYFDWCFKLHLIKGMKVVPSSATILSFLFEDLE